MLTITVLTSDLGRHWEALWRLRQLKHMPALLTISYRCWGSLTHLDAFDVWPLCTLWGWKLRSRWRWCWLRWLYNFCTSVEWWCDCWCNLLVSNLPSFQILNSLCMALLSCSIIQSRDRCSRAKFFLYSVGIFPNMIGMSKSPYDSWLFHHMQVLEYGFLLCRRRLENCSHSHWGGGISSSASMYALWILYGCPNLSLRRLIAWS